jgi:hypothetical protein
MIMIQLTLITSQRVIGEDLPANYKEHFKLQPGHNREFKSSPRRARRRGGEQKAISDGESPRLPLPHPPPFTDNLFLFKDNRHNDSVNNVAAQNHRQIGGLFMNFSLVMKRLV